MADQRKTERQLEQEYVMWYLDRNKVTMHDKMLWWHDRAIELAVADGSKENSDV